MAACGASVACLLIPVITLFACLNDTVAAARTRLQPANRSTTVVIPTIAVVTLLVMVKTPISAVVQLDVARGRATVTTDTIAVIAGLRRGADNAISARQRAEGKGM